MTEMNSYQRTLEPDSETRDNGDLPLTLHLDLVIQNPETIAELCMHPEGEPRERFALEALRIGVLALKTARGQLDGDLIRRESDRLLQSLHNRLESHSQLIHDRLTTSLKEYFDPNGGRFQERVDRLIRKDGELEQLLRRQIGSEDSEMCKALSTHLGEESPLLQQLNPDESKGVLAALRGTLDEQLQLQRNQVLGQFSLDNKDGALARFIGELTNQNGELTDKLKTRIDSVVREFSLDDDDSALSRLVRNVDRAQRTITSEFSLDDDDSALSRLKKMMEDTNAAIHGHLSLDDEQSALARLKRELLKLHEDHRKSNQTFQEEVKGALQAMVARKQEADRSTRHGLDFEEAVFEFVQREAQNTGDIATHTGNSTGRIKNCKIGDAVIELGPESAAPGEKLVVEAKEKSGYSLADGRSEIETARKNRDAQIGLFVFSKETAPNGLDPLRRCGGDVFVVWDHDDVATDVFLSAGISLARALCVRHQKQAQETSADFSEIDKAILEIEKRAGALDDIETWAGTIHKNSEKILGKVRTSRKAFTKQVEILREHTAAVRRAMQETAN